MIRAHDLGLGVCNDRMDPLQELLWLLRINQRFMLEDDIFEPPVTREGVGDDRCVGIDIVERETGQLLRVEYGEHFHFQESRSVAFHG